MNKKSDSDSDVELSGQEEDFKKERGPRGYKQRQSNQGRGVPNPKSYDNKNKGFGNNKSGQKFHQKQQYNIQAASIMAMMEGNNPEPRYHSNQINLNDKNQIFLTGKKFYKDSFLSDPWE